MQAQTEMKDRPICVARGDQGIPSVAQPTRSDVVVTVWEDRREEGARGSDIFIQLVDAESGIPRWVGPRGYISGVGYADVVTDRFDGIAVCTAPGDQLSPRAAYDGMGGVIVTWEDYRNDANGLVGDIYAQRFELSTGRHDPNWPADGIAICQTGYHSERPRIVGTDNGAFITWIDHRNSAGSQPPVRDVRLQYIHSATATFPPPPTSWVQDGILVPWLPDPDQINPELDVDHIPLPDGLGGLAQGVVLTWQDARDFGGPGSAMWRVMASRIGADGNRLYAAPYDMPVTQLAPGDQEYPRVITTGKQYVAIDRRAIIVWQDDGANPGSYSPDILSQAFDPVGTAMFGPQGAIVCDAPGAQRLPQPTLWESFDQQSQTFTPYVTVGWIDYRDYAIIGTDIYAGLLDASGPGVMVNPQGSNGEAICQAPFDQYQLSMDNVFYGTVPYEHTVFVWRHYTGQEYDIWYQEVDLTIWLPMLAPDGWPVTEARGDQVLPQASRRVFVWQDGRRQPIPNDTQDDDNIYCQTPGDCTGPTQMAWRDQFAFWTWGRDAENLRFVADPGDGSTYIVWDEVRHPHGLPGPDYRIVFIQKLDRYGVPRWSNNGVAVSLYYVPPSSDAYSVNARLPDVCIDGQGGARVVWEQEIYGSSPAKFRCFSSHVTADGVVNFPGHGWGREDNDLYDYREPRILAVNDASTHAIIACLSDEPIPSGTPPRYRQPMFVNWRVGLGPWDTQDIDDRANHHENLIIAWDGNNYWYALSNDATSSVIDITGWDNGSFAWMSKSTIDYDTFNGYDLTAGNTGGVLGSSALLAYAIVPPGATTSDVFVHTYSLGALSDILNLTQNSNTEYSSQPAIDADSVRIAYSAEEGALLVWNTEYSGSGGTFHRVEANRVTFPDPWPMPGQPEFSPNLTLDLGLTMPTSPDIARVIDHMPGLDGPRAVAVWEGGGETSQCYPARPTEIYGQHILFDASHPNAGVQWPQPLMVGPGPGNYHQRLPMVKASYPDEVAVYWYDSQNTENGLMGTLLSNFPATIRWVKRGDDAVLQARAFDISGVWPQPAYLDGGDVHISCIAPEDTEILLEIHDLLGRRVALLYEGRMQQAGMTARFNPRRLGLGGGVWMLRMSSAESQASRTLLLLR
jgi:hypothetical protein